MEGLFDCDARKEARRLTQTRRIEAAPELLRIQLSAVSRQGKPMVPKHNPIRINEYIDPTEHLVAQQQQGHVAPPKYRLHTVLYHIEIARSLCGIGSWSTGCVPSGRRTAVKA